MGLNTFIVWKYYDMKIIINRKVTGEMYENTIDSKAGAKGD
jgi:hypothetical protein